MKRLIGVILACFAVLTLSAAPKDIIIGLSIPVTGSQAAGGQQALYGAQLAVDLG